MYRPDRAMGNTKSQNSRPNPVTLFIFMFFVFLFFACSIGDTWEGVVYPNKDDLTHHSNLGKFSSLEKCRDAALGVLEELNAMTRGDYECGLNCKDSDYSGIRVCKETLK